MQRSDANPKSAPLSFLTGSEVISGDTSFTDIFCILSHHINREVLE